MQLNFNSKYISIDIFNPVELSDFVVLTGVNGSGKSHLLEAIEKRHVTISGMEQANIVHFNYETFRLENEQGFTGHQLAADREAAWNYHNQAIKPQIEQWRSSLGENYETLKASCKTEKKNFLNLLSDKITPYKTQIKAFFNKPNIKNQQHAHGIHSLAKKIPYSIDEIGHDDFVKKYKPYTFKKDFLPNQLGKIIWDYQVKYHRNQVNEYQNAKKGKNLAVLSEKEFIKEHGEKPWELINRILKEFDTMKYKVKSPEDMDVFENYQLKLIHTEKENVEIDFSSLSSGEKILMALVASVYKSSSDKHFPDILLLDEVDASLHPSMMKNMLQVIKNIFLKEGVKVILVTHSPTTIALAPEESIFVMNRSGRNRLEKKSKQDALKILTQGYATIEQGLKLFDEVAKSNVTIITEGHNTKLISKALQLYECTDVTILEGVEGNTGKDQLKTLFRFLSTITHSNKVIFVWDCDVKFQLENSNNTYPFILPKNSDNFIVQKGIENMFPEELFKRFKKTTTLSNGESIVQFDDTRKKDFANSILRRNKKEDFQNFLPLIDEIKRIIQI